MSKIRPSPSESAGDHKYFLKKGNDNNLWVSIPNKNDIYHWTKLKNKKPGDLLESIYDKLPMQIKNKFEPCKAFLKFINTHLVNKIPKTLFYYYQTLIDEYIDLSLESDDSSINILNPQNFYELDGHFHKSHTDDLLKLLFAENPNIDYIYLFPDLELLYSLFKKNESKIELRGFARDINYNQSSENLNPITFTKEYRENIYNILSNKYKMPVAKVRKNTNLKNKYTKSNYFPNYDNHFITVYYDNISKKGGSKKSKKSRKSRKSKK